MKTLLLSFFVACSIHAAPITYSYEGAYAPIANGIYVNLQDHYYNSDEDRIVTITASEPLSNFSAFFDNLPNSVGSGFIVYLDDVLVMNTGLGQLVTATLSFSSLDPFTRIRIETNSAPYWIERGTITNFVGTAADPGDPPIITTFGDISDPEPPPTPPAVHNPEPATLWLAGPSLLLCYWVARKRQAVG